MGFVDGDYQNRMVLFVFVILLISVEFEVLINNYFRDILVNRILVEIEG